MREIIRLLTDNNTNLKLFSRNQCVRTFYCFNRNVYSVFVRPLSDYKVQKSKTFIFIFLFFKKGTDDLSHIESMNIPG